MTGSNSTKILAAIRTAIDRKPETPTREIVEHLEGDEPELFTEWAKDLAREKAHSLIVAQFRPKQSDDPYQMFFPGFQRLSTRLPLKQGFVELRHATITRLRESLLVIQSRAQKRKQPRRDALQTLISEMEPYSRALTGLRFERFCEMRAAGVPAPPTGLTREQRSMIARANWASMTPAERSAIAKTREAKKAVRKAR